MAASQNQHRHGRLVLFCTLMGTLCKIGVGQIRYSVPEETDKGTVVGNISKDLGLEPRELAERGVRIVSRGRSQLGLKVCIIKFGNSCTLNKMSV